MFEGSLVESTALLQSRNRWPALLSFAAQALVALVIVAVPILHPELLPMHAPSLSITPPPLPRPPQPPLPVQHLRTAVAEASAPEAPSAPAAHTSLIHTFLPSPSNTVDTPVSTVLGPMTNNSPGVLDIGDSRGHTPNVTVVSSAPPAHASPLHISAGVTAGLLLAPIRPAYPAIAKAARVEGAVVIRAMISRTGRIEQAQVLSGSPMLQGAALEAVEQAHYRPFLLNGEPTEVDTTITVNFRLGS